MNILKKIGWQCILFILGCVPQPDKVYTKYSIFDISYNDTPGIVMITSGFGKSELCTGVAITENSVLTAAHCAFLPEDVLSIKYGCNKIDTSCENSDVYEIILHPDYLINDLAILKTGFINRSIANVEDFNIRQNILLLAGYGRNPTGEIGKLFGVIGLDIQYTDWSNSFNVKMDQGDGLCFGNSGGPAYDFNNNHVIGILSSSILDIEKYKCGGLLKYMYLPYYNKWIMDNK